MSRNVTLEQLDQKIEWWRTTLATVADNLMALHAWPTLRILEGSSGTPPLALTGRTEREVTPALTAMRESFSRFSTLTGVLERADGMRKKLPRIFAQDEIRAIWELLTGPSVRLPPPQTPLAQRSLLDTGQGALVSPAQLLDAMVAAFEQAGAVVQAVDEAWKRLFPALDAVEQEARELQALSGSLGEGSVPELISLQQRIEAIRNSVRSDPLDTTAGVEDEVRPLLAEARARLNELKKQRDQVKAKLAAAQTLMQQLEETHRKAKQACAERKLKVQVDPPPEGFPDPLDDALVTALAAWLDRLEETLRQGKWRAAAVGVANVTTQLQRRLSAVEIVYRTNQAPLDERRELRGLLDALEVKAQAAGLGEDPELGAIQADARQLLSRRPTPLSQVRPLVRDYKARLE